MFGESGCSGGLVANIFEDMAIFGLIQSVKKEESIHNGHDRIHP